MSNIKPPLAPTIYFYNEQLSRSGLNRETVGIHTWCMYENYINGSETKCLCSCRPYETLCDKANNSYTLRVPLVSKRTKQSSEGNVWYTFNSQKSLSFELSRDILA